jgi:hypothetical protein
MTRHQEPLGHSARLPCVNSTIATTRRSRSQWNGGDPLNDSAFAARLNELSGQEITHLAAFLRVELDTPDGEVSWWRATIAVGATLKQCHRTRMASLAAHQASTAVQAAATAASGSDAPSRDDVIVVARAAAEVARALVAGLPDHAAAPLFAAWETVAA